MSGSLIRFKRGNKADLPKSATSGTPLWCEDTKELYIGDGNGVSKVGAVSNMVDNNSLLNLIGVSSGDSSNFKTNNLVSIQGSSINAQNFNGLAQKATSDADGNEITETYATKNEIEGLSSYQPPILSSQWFDHILNDLSWLRADTYSWHNGTAYSNIYNELLSEYNNENSIEKQLLKITPITLPSFTSNTTSGITVSDSREYADCYTLINGVTYKPIGAWETYWFNIDYNRDTFLNSYSIRADNNGSPEYPSAWVLNGSNDGETWVKLDEQTGQSFSLNQTKTYTVNCKVKYKQYRLVFSNGALSSGSGELGRLTFNADQVDVDISYKLTPKGYKIANVDYIDSVAEKYEFDGISWFYVIDTENQQFKLPRTKFGFRGLRSNVGDDINESLPNITGGNFFYENGCTDFWGAIYNSGTGVGSSGGRDSDNPVGKFDASRSSSTYQDGAPVQERATQMYLYFYAGQYTKTAIEQTAGLNSELINTKVDISSLSYINPIVESFVDGTSGYNIWANGLCEQWGQVNVSANSSVLITLLKRMLNTNYFASGTNYSYFDSNRYSTTPCIKKTSDSQITVCNIEDTTVTYGWYVKGYLANGEY